MCSFVFPSEVSFIGSTKKSCTCDKAMINALRLTTNSPLEWWYESNWYFTSSVTLYKHFRIFNPSVIEMLIQLLEYVMLESRTIKLYCQVLLSMISKKILHVKDCYLNHALQGALHPKPKLSICCILPQNHQHFFCKLKDDIKGLDFLDLPSLMQFLSYWSKYAMFWIWSVAQESFCQLLFYCH